MALVIVVVGSVIGRLLLCIAPFNSIYQPFSIWHASLSVHWQEVQGLQNIWSAFCPQF